MVEKFYFDSCIWINLFKEEGDKTKGTPYFELALKLIEKIQNSNSKIFVSTIVMKELFYKLGNEKFNYAKRYMKKLDFVEIIKTTTKDYDVAREFEHDDSYNISFYDYLHVALSKRLNFIFITRDKDLINFSKKIIKTKKPEDLITK